MRDRSVDVAKGIAIVAIVVGHVNRGVAAAGMGAEWSPDLDRVLYLFHLSVFAYLAGLFLRYGVERDGVGTFLVRRTSLFVWLYVLWHVLQVLVKIATASLVNAPVTWVDLVRIWIPQGQLWFLPWLVAVTALTAWLRPWSSRGRALGILTLAAVVALATWGTDPSLAFTRGWALLLPFAVGATVGPGGHRRAFAGRRAVGAAVLGICLLLVVALGTTAVPPTVDAPDRTWLAIALGCLGCLAGSVGVLGLAAWVSRLGRQRALTLLGERSLEIFLAHIIAGAGARILLSLAGVRDPGAHLVVGVCVGLGASVLLAGVSRSWHFAWLFQLPPIASRGLAGSPVKRDRAQA